MEIVSGCVYKLVCNKTGEVYYGSTEVDVKIRLMGHIREARCSKPRRHAKSKQIIDRGDYCIECVEQFENLTKQELRIKEGEYISNNDCINKNVAGRSPQQSKEDNKEKYKERKKECDKKYREENKEKVFENKKIYYEENKEKIKEHRSEKIECECGAIVCRGDIARHRRSKKHKELTE